MGNVFEELDRIQRQAKADEALRQALLATRQTQRPLQAFCRVCADYGYAVSAIELVTAGEEAYAAMRRSTNGGGENSPLLAGEDDLYELFLIALEGMGKDGGGFS